MQTPVLLPSIRPISRRMRRAALLGSVLGLAALAPATAQTLYGLSGTNLVTFQASAPGTLTATTAITGVATGQTIVGMDVRPNTGELFALGYSAATTTAQLYRINVSSGAATAVGTALTLNLGGATDRIGFDFNPTVDRIRVTSTNRANLRLNPNDGALAATDGQLTYAPADANSAQTPGVGASAYTNSYIGTGSTTLYNVDEVNSRLVSQVPPNDGTLNTIGALGVTTSGATQSTDLDIAYNATNQTNTAYLVVTMAGTSTGTTLYTVNLTTGAATAAGAVGTAASMVTDIAVAIDRTVPATLTGRLIYAVSGTNLLSFDSALPGTIRTLTPITGLTAGQALVGVDFRPATNQLFALGYSAANTTAQLYRINLTTGAATTVGAALTLNLGAATDRIGFDFNPTVDRIRVTSTNRANLRLNPNDGTLAATDGQLNFAATDANASATPSVSASAYTNNLSGATTTTLFNYDDALNVLVSQTPPNDGVLNTVGSSGITVNRTTNSVDFDIITDGTTNLALLAASTGTATSDNIYSVNLTTGTATLVGPVGGGINISGMAAYSQAGLPTATVPSVLAAQVSLYPNPAQGSANLVLPTELTKQPLTVRVLNALGQEVSLQTLSARGAQPAAISLAGVKTGLYLVQVTTAEGQLTKRLFVE
ncbi:DUF4394 domain-containing protein [Hymenobacter oligotrophus]|uniref:DUF4394 domain-containing protein n=1 Tax=Hymenobacter oligotrophus TaxID=2319843 RepID=A0A3B7RPE5_9BACT|nr:DUF4394 domain-containing protein [Hymenobacter oligotrophus]AYA36087.1 DUF4394 domain-containing protein [Hymenobacter oligotrophus]